VVATDIDTHLLEALPYHNLSVMRHDVASEPLPTDTFDLVHTHDRVRHDYILKTPKVVSGIGAFSAAEIPSASTRLVSRGSMMPSSQSRAVE